MSNASTKTENASEKSAHPGRDAKGRFTLGNLGGPGNPFNRQISALRKELANTCTPERLRKIANKMMDLADNGDVAAARLVFTFVLGKPTVMPNPDRVDADELHTYRETVTLKDEAAVLGAVGSAGFHLRGIRAMQPTVDFLNQQELSRMLREEMASPEEKAKRAAEKAKREDEEAAEVAAFLNTPVPDDDPRVQYLGLGGGRPSPSPSTNGDIGHGSPLANGDIRAVSPSTNGRNGKKRSRKQRKADKAAYLAAKDRFKLGA